MYLGRIMLAALALGLSPLAQAGDLDVNLNNDVVRLSYRFPLTDTGLAGDLGWLHHSDGGDLLHVGVMLIDEAGHGKEAFTAGLGGRVIRVDGGAGGASGTALAIGGSFRYVFPDYNRFAFAGAAFLAPSVTSFADLEGYYEAMLRAEYRVLEHGSVYLGLRSISADFGPGRSSIDDGLHVGVDIAF